MLRAYGPACDGRLVDAERQKTPDGATWIDLEEPARDKERPIEDCLELEIQTSEQLAEIELMLASAVLPPWYLRRRGWI